jgi:serine/threonine-protein kinase RIO1
MTGLRLMHNAQYVHRDISSGNVLCYENRGLISDLEYVKLITDDRKHDVRTVCG